VSVNRLGKQLRRELKAHPKKAALLALLLAVGLYYWTPVVRGWFSSKTMSTPSPSIATPPQTAATGAAASPAIPWQDLVEAMKRDALKAPAKNVSSWRDPFRPSAQQVAIIEKERQLRENLPKATGTGADSAKAIVVRPREMTPDNAGLSVTSTLVSSTQKMASIKGNIVEDDRIVKQAIVAEGATIRVRSGSDETDFGVPASKKPAKSGGKTKDTSTAATERIGTTVSFRVARIDPGTVTLEYRGREYELLMAKPKPAGKLKIRKAEEMEKE
jgi:hypothetical protein